MAPLLRFTTNVLPGNRVEITSPEFVEGDEVEVLIFPGDQSGRSVLDLLKSTPPPGGFKTAEEADEYLREERDSWDR